MIQFRLDKHAFKEESIIEIWREDKEFLASIYPTESGIKIISKYSMFQSKGKTKLASTIRIDII